MRLIKIRNVYYCYHPDGVQDDNEPKGYRILPTGKWVVEWDVLPYQPTIINIHAPDHYKAEFRTEPEAKVFYDKIMNRLSEDGHMPLWHCPFLRSYRLKK